MKIKRAALSGMKKKMMKERVKEQKEVPTLCNTRLLMQTMTDQMKKKKQQKKSVERKESLRFHSVTQMKSYAVCHSSWTARAATVRLTVKKINHSLGDKISQAFFFSTSSQGRNEFDLCAAAFHFEL